MKKLMITAFALAAGIAMGATPLAQVYDVTLKIKTTSAATGSVNNKQNPFAVDTYGGSRSIIYRKQANSTWKGLIWGCGCEAINGKWEVVKNDVDAVQGQTVKGCIIWDTKTKQPVYIGNGSDLTDVGSVPGKDFGWQLIHAINRDGKQVEGVWTMSQAGNACNESGILFDFAGAGFGTANVVTECGVPTSLSYIKSISGNFAGYMRAPSKYTTASWSGCSYCGIKGGETTCDFAEAWRWCDLTGACDCGIGDTDLDATAAYGTWMVKYNSSLSKKLAQPVKVSSKGVDGVVVSIRDVYDFKDLPAVEAAIAAVENKIWGIRTVCEELADAVTDAEAEVYAATTNKAYVSTENLERLRDEAKAAWKAANDELNAAKLAETASNAVAYRASASYDKQLSFVTNRQWTVIYKNASHDLAKASNRGLDTFEALIDDIKRFTFISVWYDDATLTGFIVPASYKSASAFVDEQNAKTEALKTAFDEAADGVEYAEAETAAKQAVADDLASAYSAANRAYTDRATLQLLAAQRLIAAENALSRAQAAYDIRCN